MTKMAKEQTFRTIVREVRDARYSGTISNRILLESGEVYSVMNERIKVVTRYFEIIVLCLFVGKGFFIVFDSVRRNVSNQLIFNKINNHLLEEKI